MNEIKEYWARVPPIPISYDQDILSDANDRLIAAIYHSFLEDLEKVISKLVNDYDNEYNRSAFDYYIEKLRTLRIFVNNKAIVNNIIQEDFFMAVQRRNNKAAKEEKQNKTRDFHLIGDNKNDLKIKLYGDGEKGKKSVYTKFFALLTINGIQISGYAYMADDDAKEDGKSSFFNMPSYYSESKDEYIKQVSIKDEGIQEDLNQLMELVDDSLNL